MVKIRLKRMGAKKRPFYRLVVADARSPRDGRFIEAVGYYDPLPNPARVEIDADRVREWMRRGARPSDIARKLLEQQGVIQRSARTHATAAPPSGSAEAERPAGEEAASVEDTQAVEEAGHSDEGGEEQA